MNDRREERRKSQRFPFREDILVSGIAPCTSNEISEDGIFVSAMQEFKVGQVVNVTIPLGEEQIRVKGEVRFCQPGIGMGIMFHELTNEQKVKIKELVACLSGSNSKEVRDGWLFCLSNSKVSAG